MIATDTAMAIKGWSGRLKPHQDGKQKNGERNHREGESNDEQVDCPFGEPGEREKKVSSHLNRQATGKLPDVGGEAVGSRRTVNDHQAWENALELLQILQQFPGPCIGQSDHRTLYTTGPYGCGETQVKNWKAIPEAKRMSGGKNSDWPQPNLGMYFQFLDDLCGLVTGVKDGDRDSPPGPMATGG
jgi:hypothetical protein